jgi:hypothetical protein
MLASDGTGLTPAGGLPAVAVRPSESVLPYGRRDSGFSRPIRLQVPWEMCPFGKWLQIFFRIFPCLYAIAKPFRQRLRLKVLGAIQGPRPGKQVYRAGLHQASLRFKHEKTPYDRPARPASKQSQGE